MKKFTLAFIIFIFLTPRIFAQTQQFNYKRVLTWKVEPDGTKSQDKFKNKMGTILLSNTLIKIDNKVYKVDSLRIINSVAKYYIKPSLRWTYIPIVYVFLNDDNVNSIFCVEFIPNSSVHKMYFTFK